MCNASIYGLEKEEILEQFGPMLLTSRYEGFPMTVLEAWKFGNPCIVTPGTNVSCEIEEYNLGWTAELDALKIADTLEEAYKDYSVNREEYVTRCKNYVEHHYLWNEIALKSYGLLKGNLEKFCSINERKYDI